MKINKKIITYSLAMIMMVTVLCSVVSAASGYQGYAIYRDGAIVIEYHAGIMSSPYSTYPYPVLHSPGGSEEVKWGWWPEFMNGKNFVGVYKLNSDPSSSERDLHVALADSLRNQNIAYSTWYQVNYDTSTAGTWVDPSEITGMRCDGVVEYVYEYYDERVYGSDTKWNVSLNASGNKSHHSGILITPKKQLDYLTLVTTSVPSN